jgi:hypothetical protein
MKGLTLEQSLSEYTKFLELLDKYIPAERMVLIKEFFGYRELTLTSSPYSIIQDSVGAYPGGYIVSVNKLIESALVLDRVWDKFSSNKHYTLEELVFSAAFCEIGKLGSNDEPFFLPNDNEWEIKNRKLLFKYNTTSTNMKYSDKALYILQQSGIKVSENEFLAIKMYNSLIDEDNNFYFRRDVELKSKLHIILNQAYQIVNNTK